MKYTLRELYDMGMSFERAVRKDLEAKNYFVMRSAGSRGPVDVMGMKDGQVLLIQCKVAGKLKLREYIRLLKVAKMTLGTIALATRDKKNRKILYKRLIRPNIQFEP